jgi:predicted ester cyclase
MADHERAVRRLFEDVWNGANPDTSADLVHDDYTIHDRDLADRLAGPELYTALATGTREAFPDATFTIDDVVADGDTIAVRWTMTGTHEGPLADEEPTGRTVELAGMEFDRFTDGLLRETWTQSDQLGLLRQVDALPD